MTVNGSSGRIIVVKRVSVVGNSGSGKTTFARQLAETLGAPYVELDELNHQPNWQPMEQSRMLSELETITRADKWVIDGNYRSYVMDGPVWQRADTVIWLDLPRAIVMRQIIARTIKRGVLRQELWNGNRESLANLFRWDPHKSVVRWAWTQHGVYAQRYESAIKSDLYGYLDFVRLCSRGEAAQWLSQLPSS